jgi:hypothetical protein
VLSARIPAPAKRERLHHFSADVGQRLTSKAHPLGPWQGMASLQRPSLTNVFRVASEMQSGRKFRGIRSNILPPLAEKRKQERIPSPGHAPGICLCSDPFSNCKDQNFSAALGGHIPRARSGRSRAGKGPPGLTWRLTSAPETSPPSVPQFQFKLGTDNQYGSHLTFSRLRNQTGPQGDREVLAKSPATKRGTEGLHKRNFATYQPWQCHNVPKMY